MLEKKLVWVYWAQLAMFMACYTIWATTHARSVIGMYKKLRVAAIITKNVMF